MREDARIILSYIIERIAGRHYELLVDDATVKVDGTHVVVDKPTSEHKFDIEDPECHLKVKACLEEEENFVTIDYNGYCYAILTSKLKEIMSSRTCTSDKCRMILDASKEMHMMNLHTDLYLDDSIGAWRDFEETVKGWTT